MNTKPGLFHSWADFGIVIMIALLCWAAFNLIIWACK